MISKNILILTPFYPPNIGGAETFTEGLVKEASKWFNVTVLTFKSFSGMGESYTERFFRRGSLKVYRLSWPIKQTGAWKGTGLRNLLSVVPKKTLFAFILMFKNRYEIVHAQGFISAIIGLILKKVFKCKLFITVLALYNFKDWKGIKRKLIQKVLCECDAIFVEGESGLMDLTDIENFNNFCKRIKKFNHWVDQDIFKPPKNRLNDKIRILFVGRPIPEKGRGIVEAAERILNNPKYEFRYIENLPHDDLVRHYQDCHILCVPSLYQEGFARVVAEGASCGCLIIASNRGSLKEMTDKIGYSIQPTGEEFSCLIEGFNARYKTGYFGFMEEAQRKFNKKNAEVFLNEYTEK